MLKVDIEAIERLFWPNGSSRSVWMILDFARDRRIYSDLLNSHLVYSCLYSGDIPFELEVSAPHLVQLEYGDKETRSLLQRSWGRSWGTFLRCDVRMEKLRRHLRTLLVVKSWSGERMLFRYYDPRVLRVYLPTCTSEELKTVFGPIQHYFAESETAESLTGFEVKSGNLVTDELDVRGLRLPAVTHE
jgi:hypothetical protein